MKLKNLFAVVLGSLIVFALSLPVMAQSTTESTTTTTQAPPATLPDQDRRTICCPQPVDGRDAVERLPLAARSGNSQACPGCLHSNVACPPQAMHKPVHRPG